MTRKGDRAVRSQLCWGLALALLGLPMPAGAQSAGDLVVIVQTQRSADHANDVCAAGIIIAQSLTRTLILTADHVLRDAGDVPLFVQSSKLVGSKFAATVLGGSSLRNANHDYAVLSVDDPRLPRVDQGSFSVLGPLRNADSTTKTVRTIGSPGCAGWKSAEELGRVNTATDAEITFVSAAKEGASGGPVVTVDGDLVAMVTHADGREATALPISLVAQILRGQNVEFNLANSRFLVPWDASSFPEPFRSAAESARALQHRQSTQQFAIEGYKSRDKANEAIKNADTALVGFGVEERVLAGGRRFLFRGTLSRSGLAAGAGTLSVYEGDRLVRTVWGSFMSSDPKKFPTIEGPGYIEYAPGDALGRVSAVGGIASSAGVVTLRLVNGDTVMQPWVDGAPAATGVFARWAKDGTITEGRYGGKNEILEYITWSKSGRFLSTAKGGKLFP